MNSRVQRPTPGSGGPRGPQEVVEVDRLQVGVCIELPGRWMDHPFLFNRFRIRSNRQIEMLRRLGLSRVEWIPERSEQPPLPARETEGPAPAPADPPPDEDQAAELEAILRQEQQRRIEQNRRLRRALGNCETQYRRKVGAVRELMQQLHARPAEALAGATRLVEDVAASLLEQKDYVVQLMGEQAEDAQSFHHALNVSTLSLMLGAEAGLDRGELEMVGVGALFHDLGKRRVADRVLLKRGPWTRAERLAYEQHVAYGIQLARAIPDLPEAAVRIIADHHECLDGSGFPAGLEGDQIPRPARVVAIANRFDNLCNPRDEQQALSPHEALSWMFQREGQALDQTLLAHFVRCLGVYPPGSIVELNNGIIGLVMSVNSSDTLAPVIKVYDPEVPAREAWFADLSEDPDVRVQRCIPPRELDPAIRAYLRPRRRVSYGTAAGTGQGD